MALPQGAGDSGAALLPEGGNQTWWPALLMLTPPGQATLCIWKTTLLSWASSLFLLGGPLCTESLGPV